MSALFRLDYIDRTGQPVEAVRDTVLGGDFICRHMTTARARATVAAADAQRSVLVSRIGKAGQVKGSLVIAPNGAATRPAGTRGVEREDCTKATGRACFCSACRAERRESRGTRA